MMASYKIIFKPSVERDLRRLSASVVSRILERIEGLAENPYPSQSIKLVGAERLYRIRVGDYRIIYSFEKEGGQITIHYVRHRRDAYRGLQE